MSDLAPFSHEISAAIRCAGSRRASAGLKKTGHCRENGPAGNYP